MSEIVTSARNRYASLWAGFGESVQHLGEFRGDLTLTIRPHAVRFIAQSLKEKGFACLLDLFGMDYSRFQAAGELYVPSGLAVVYIFHSMREGERIRLKAPLEEAENPCIDSLCDIFAAANWFEREAWDLFGIAFRGHPNLVRILCHQDFKGHPLRKDYPADGYQRLKTAAASEEL